METAQVEAEPVGQAAVAVGVVSTPEPGSGTPDAVPVDAPKPARERVNFGGKWGELELDSNAAEAIRNLQALQGHLSRQVGDLRQDKAELAEWSEKAWAVLQKEPKTPEVAPQANREQMLEQMRLHMENGDYEKFLESALPIMTPKLMDGLRAKFEDEVMKPRIAELDARFKPLEQLREEKLREQAPEQARQFFISVLKEYGETATSDQIDRIKGPIMEAARKGVTAYMQTQGRQPDEYALKAILGPSLLAAFRGMKPAEPRARDEAGKFVQNPPPAPSSSAPSGVTVPPGVMRPNPPWRADRNFA